MPENIPDDSNELTEFLKASDSEFEKYSEALALMQNCSLCGTPLDFAYTVEHPNELIREEVSCHHCEIKVRNKLFNIQ